MKHTSPFTLKFPETEFTHTMLAEFNGKTNQQVWGKFQESIKNNTIVFVGERRKEGQKGKPSKFYKLLSRLKEFKESIPMDVKITENKKTIIPLEPIQPVEPPVVTDIVLKTNVVPSPVIYHNESNQSSTPEQSSFQCPVCKHFLWKSNDSTGVMIWCIQPISICISSENPYGHSNNEKNAYQILCDKFRHIEPSVKSK